MDGIVIETEGLELDESQLTGEVCFTTLIYISRPLDRKIMVMIVSLIALFLIVFLFFGSVFSLVSVFNIQLLLFAVPLLATVVPLYHLMRCIVTRIADGKPKAL